MHKISLAYKRQQFPSTGDVTVLECSVDHPLHSLLPVLTVHHSIVTVRYRGEDGVGRMVDGREHCSQLLPADALIAMDVEHLQHRPANVERVYQLFFTKKRLCSCAKFGTTSVAHFSPIIAHIAFNLPLMVYLFLADLWVRVQLCI